MVPQVPFRHARSSSRDYLELATYIRAIMDHTLDEKKSGMRREIGAKRTRGLQGDEMLRSNISREDEEVEKIDGSLYFRWNQARGVRFFGS